MSPIRQRFVPSLINACTRHPYRLPQFNAI